MDMPVKTRKIHVLCRAYMFITSEILTSDMKGPYCTLLVHEHQQKVIMVLNFGLFTGSLHFSGCFESLTRSHFSPQ